MKRKRVWLMCGCPGSGKSTWLKNNVKYPHQVVVSRDAIRFSLLKDNDDYFSKEKEVWRTYVKTIRNYIENDENITEIYLDATHLNPKSREKILKELPMNKIEICVVNFIIPFDLCLERNAQRTGRAKVPDEVIMNMYDSFIPANNFEKYSYSYIKFVND